MKQGRPVLYELLTANDSARGASATSNGHHAPARIEGLAEETEPVRWIAPGRSMRVPYGYLFIGIAVVIVLAAAAFMFGFLRGQDGTGTGFDSDLETGEVAAGPGQSPPITAPGGGTRSASGADRSASIQPGGGGVRTGAGPIESDPRRVDYNYFYLIQRTSREGAIGVAEFCRSSGLEAYVVEANNGREFTVFVLPGHLAEDRQSGAVKALEDRVEEIKLRWKARFGRDDIGISLEKFKG